MDRTLQTDPIFQHWREIFDFNNFPKQWKAWFDALKPEEKTQWFLDRYDCLKNPIYLSGFAETKKPGDEDLPVDYTPILGMDFQPDPHALLFSRFVQKMPGQDLVLSDLSRLTKKFMILWPRGLFKTSAVVVDIVQTILNYPNVRICFLTGGDQLAKRQLARVKRVFEKPTKKFKTLFPEFCLKSVQDKKNLQWRDENVKMGNAHEFTVPARTNDTFAEPTFAISTAKSVKAGSHFDIIYIDDLVNEQNYRSVKALEKCYQDYIDICPLLEPTGFIIMTGTRYSYGDTYERIQDMAKEEEKKLGRTIWSFSIRDCWSMGCKNCKHTDVYHNREINILQPPCSVPGCQCMGFEANGSKGVLFPETRTHDGRSIGHTLEFLEGERMRLGPEFFANQYENNPIATGTQVFTEALIGAQTLFDINQIPSYGLSATFLIGDLAYVGQEGRDYSVIYACRMYKGQLFVFDCEFGNWDSAQVADNTLNMILRHRPNMLYYEKINGWEAYDKIIRAEASKRGIQNIPLQWEKGSQAANAKLIRIGSIKGWLSSRRLWLYAHMKGYAVLVQQLVKWPKLGRHDDFADTLGMVVAAPTGVQLENPPAATSTANWLRKLGQSDTTEDPYRDNGCGTGIVCSWVMFLTFFPIVRGILHCLCT